MKGAKNEGALTALRTAWYQLRTFQKCTFRSLAPDLQNRELGVGAVLATVFGTRFPGESKMWELGSGKCPFTCHLPQGSPHFKKVPGLSPRLTTRLFLSERVNSLN